MAIKRYRAVAHFPTVDKGTILNAEARAGSWSAALGMVARELKKQTVLKRRRITAMSITLTQMEGADMPSDAADATGEQMSLAEGPNDAAEDEGGT